MEYMFREGIMKKALWLAVLVCIGASGIQAAEWKVEGECSPELVRRVTAGELGFNSLIVVERPRLFCSHIYDYHLSRVTGGGLLRVDLTEGEDGVEAVIHRLVDAEEGGRGGILDAVLSYDGEEILFSWWRDSLGRRLHIYRVGIDGSGLTQLTEGDHDNFNPAWLPDGGIAFLSTRLPQFAYCWVSSTGILYRMDRDGSRVVRLSAGHLQEFTPAVLEDGRIIYGRWEYVDRDALPFQSLWTIRPDGTGLSGYFGNRVLSPATFMEARQIPGTPKVLSLMTGHGHEPWGAVGMIDVRRGANAQEAIRNLTPEVTIHPVDHMGNAITVDGPYENPFPVDDRYFLVSHRGTVLLRDYEGTEQAVLLRPEHEWNYGWISPKHLGFHNPQPLRATRRPPVLSDAREHLAASEQPEERVSATGLATIIVQDVYKGIEDHVARGEIAAIRVVQELARPSIPEVKIEARAFEWYQPVVSSAATYAPKKVWGDAPVDQDGSAHFEAPSGVPLHFLALDREGRTVQRMRTFTHFMPDETQSCVGCHADRNHVAPAATNAFPSSLLREPDKLQEPEWGVRGLSYAHDVQPVWDRHCAGCHNAHRPSGGLDLSGDMTDFFNVSYEHLVRRGTHYENPRIADRQPSAGSPPARAFGRNSGMGFRYIRWIPTSNFSGRNVFELEPRRWGSPASLLADLLLEGHPDADGRPRVQLSDEEKRRVFTWIDLNVPYYHTSATVHGNLPGGRRMWPEELDEVLEDVSARRCVSCHADGEGNPAVPLTFYLRVTSPELNSFMLAPLARDAGGTEACGLAVFESKDDPDYQAILQTFNPILELLKAEPREDMLPESQLGSVTDCCPCPDNGQDGHGAH